MAKNQRSIKWVDYDVYDPTFTTIDITRMVNTRLKELQDDPAIRVDYIHFKPVAFGDVFYTFVTISGRRLETPDVEDMECD